MAKNSSTQIEVPASVAGGTAKTKEVTAVLGLLPESTRLLFLRQLADAVTIDTGGAPRRASPTRDSSPRHSRSPGHPTSRGGRSRAAPPGLSGCARIENETPVTSLSLALGEARAGLVRPSPTRSSPLDESLWQYNCRKTRGCICCTTPAERETDTVSDGAAPCHSSFSSPCRLGVTSPQSCQSSRAPPLPGRPVLTPTQAKIKRVLNRWDKEVIPKARAKEQEEEAHRLERAVRQAERLRGATMKLATQLGTSKARMSILQAFNTWRYAAQAAVVVRNQQERSLLVTLTSRLTEESKALAGKLARIKALWAVWHAWRSNGRVNFWEKRYASHVLASMRKRRCTAKRSALRAWAAQARLQQRMKSVAGAAVKRWRKRQLAMAWFTWREKTAQLRRAKSLVVRMKDRRLATAFRTWVDVVKEGQSRVKVLVTVLRHWKAHTLRDAFHMWVEEVKSRKKSLAMADKAASRWSARLLSRAFKAWRDAIVDNQRHEQLLRRAVQRLQRLGLRCAFDTWASSLGNNTRRLERVAVLMKRIQNHQIAGCWNRWCEVIQEGRRKRALLARGVARLQHVLVGRAFGRWVEWVQIMRRARRTALHVVASMTQATLTKAFLGWRMANLMTPENSEASSVSERSGISSCPASLPSRYSPEEKLLQTINRWSQRKQAAVLRAWCLYTKRQNQVERALGKAVQRWRYRTLLSAFSKFRFNVFMQHTRRDRLVAAALGQMGLQSTLAVMMERWKVATLVGQKRRLKDRLHHSQQDVERWEARSNQLVTRHEDEIRKMVRASDADAARGALEVHVAGQERRIGRCKRLVRRVVVAMWRQGAVRTYFSAWRLHVERNSRKQRDDTVARAKQSLQTLARELHAESSSRRVLEESMANIVSARLGEAVSTRVMLEEVEGQMATLKTRLFSSSPDIPTSSLSLAPASLTKSSTARSVTLTRGASSLATEPAVARTAPILAPGMDKQLSSACADCKHKPTINAATDISMEGISRVPRGMNGMAETRAPAATPSAISVSDQGQMRRIVKQ